MSRDEDKSTVWQFRIWHLLFFTAFIALVMGAYRFAPHVGFLMTVLTTALVGGELLRRRGFDDEVGGILGSIGGGAFAGASQIAIYLLCAAIRGPWNDYQDLGIGSIDVMIFLCPLGAGIGGIFGCFFWGIFRGSVHCIHKAIAVLR